MITMRRPGLHALGSHRSEIVAPSQTETDSWLGARGTRVVYTLRKLTAYCVADRFVVTGREFVWVCLMPFLVLNTVLLVVIVAVGGFQPVLWGMLLLHVGACSGDFAFVNLAWSHRKEGLLTYDDVAGKRTPFYSPRPTQQSDA